jgi:molybdopterin-guanine dinucleotide biosynthesis protein A
VLPGTGPKESPPLAVAVAGYSGSGKTGLLERVVRVLSGEGVSCGYLKTAVDRVELEPEGKDTDRLRRAGAAAVAIRSRTREAHFPFREDGTGGADAVPRLEAGTPAAAPGDHEIRALLWNLRSLFGRCDLVFIEGLRHSGLPKIVVNRRDNPRGVLATDGLREVLLEFDWPELPADWDEPVRRVLSVLDEFREVPCRRNARGIVGAVLAGGASRRMGRDKALLPLAEGDGTWLERAFLDLAERCATVWIVGRIAESGGAELPSLRWPARSHLDLRPGCGPLGGLETALELSRGRGVLLLPCDLPALAGEALDLLLANRDPHACATAFRHADGLPEPAVALFEARALESVRRLLDCGGRALHHFLNEAETNWVAVPPELSAGFVNLNTPADRRRAAAVVREGSD